MAIDNLYEIIAYILKEIDRNGNPDEAQEKFGISGERYDEVVKVAEKDGYFEYERIDYAGNPWLDTAVITSKGYELIKKHS